MCIAGGFTDTQHKFTPSHALDLLHLVALLVTLCDLFLINTVAFSRE